jgi:hypothetical protein
LRIISLCWRFNVEEREVDRRAEKLGIVLSRRSILKGALGLGAAVVDGVVVDRHADAARRGYSGPEVPGGSTGNGPGWWVDIAMNYQGNALDYRIRQLEDGNPFLVFFGNLTISRLYIDIDDTSRAIDTLPGYTPYTFGTAGTHRFHVWQPAGTFGGVTGPWAELNIAG